MDTMASNQASGPVLKCRDFGRAIQPANESLTVY